MEIENNQAAPSVTVDTPEFRAALMAVCHEEAVFAATAGTPNQYVGFERASAARATLLAHLEAWQYAVTAQAVAEERERAARLAIQWGNARNPDGGGNALRNYAQALRDGVQVDERNTDYHWSKAPATEASAPLAAMTDEEIKDVAIDYGQFVANDVYDVTNYDCAEDFFNCVRACIAAHKGAVGLMPDQVTEVWDSMSGRFLVDFGYQQFAQALFDKAGMRSARGQQQGGYTASTPKEVAEVLDRIVTEGAAPIVRELPSLPVFPEPDYVLSKGMDISMFWSARTIVGLIRLYGHQCRAAALEEAAKLIDPAPDMRDDELTQYGKDKRRFAAAIRALNKTEGQ